MNLSDTEFPIWWIAVLVALAALALISMARSGKPVLLRRDFILLGGLRIIALSALLLAIFNPFVRTLDPDPDAYRVVVLGDVSGSMRAADLPGPQSRLEWVNTWLGIDSAGGLARLREAHPHIDVRLFSESEAAWGGELPLEPRTGLTAIGDVLESVRVAEMQGQRRALGAVVLLSDGIEHTGLPMPEAAHRLAAIGVPVTTVGIGDQTRIAEVTIEFDSPQIVRAEDESIDLGLRVSNRFGNVQRGTVDWYRGPLMLRQDSVELEAESEQQLSLTIDDMSAGVDTIRAVFSPETHHVQSSQHTAMAIVETVADAHARILFMGSGPGWEASYLRLLSMETAILTIDSLVQIDEQRFLRLTHPQRSGSASGSNDTVQRETLTQLPEEPADYFDYNAIILDLALAAQLPESVADLLAQFVSVRGGGLLLLHNAGVGPATNASPVIAGLLREVIPARDLKAGVLNADARLQIQSHPLFIEQIGGPLLSGPPPLIAAGSPLAIPQSLSRAAQVPVSAGPEAVPIVVTHAYGAGRAAWLASDSLWQWRLSRNERTRTQFNAFWEGVLSWLAAGGKARLEASANGQLLPVEQPARLDVQLLSADYSPSVDAQLTAIVTAPDGTTTEHRMGPVLESPGKYALPLELDQPGAWQVDYEAIFPAGDSVRQTAWFSATATGPESRDIAFREKDLRDLARITGGRFIPWRDAQVIDDLPISSNIPLVDRNIFWTRTLPFLLIVLAALAVEWWLRRRLGLR